MSRLAPFGIFLLISFTLFASATFYLAWRLNFAIGKESPYRLAVWGVTGIFGLIVWSTPFLLHLRAPGSTPGAGARFLDRALTWGGYGSMGFGGVLFFTMLGFDLVALLVWGFERAGRLLASAEPGAHLSRRALLFTYAPWGALATSVGMSLRGLQTAIGGPQVKHVQIPQAGLAEGLRGMKIVQISDLHVSDMIRRPYVEKVVAMALALEPDLIAITGDVADGDPQTLREDLEPLRRLRAPLGVFYVTGNHEYYWDGPAWVATMRSFGFEVLENSHRLVSREANGARASVLVSGIPDPANQRFGHANPPDAEKAVAGAPARDFHLFLAHQPKAYVQAEKIGADLMLSGHTHAGQFYPIRLLIGFFHRYYQGLYRHADQFWVYVNQGTGFWGPPNRLGLPPEVTCLELQRA